MGGGAEFAVKMDMRRLSYILLLPLAWVGGGFAFDRLDWSLRFWFGSSLVFPISLLPSLPVALINLLIFYRVLCWVKARSFTVPDQYSGFVAFLGALAIVPMLLIIGGYGYLFAINASGISGVPLGIAVAAAGVVSIIPVAVAELRNFYALLPNKTDGSLE